MITKGRIGDLVKVMCVPTEQTAWGRIEKCQSDGGYIIRTILSKGGVAIGANGESTHGFFKVTHHWPENNIVDQQSPEYLNGLQ